jgi:hypothetical protein
MSLGYERCKGRSVKSDVLLPVQTFVCLSQNNILGLGFSICLGIIFVKYLLTKIKYVYIYLLSSSLKCKLCLV